MSDSLRPHESQHTRPPCPSPAPWVHPDPCPLSPWCHPTISSSVVPLSSCPQSFPASGSLPMSQLVASGGQSIRVSASGSVLPMNTQDWFPLGWTGCVSLKSKGHHGSKALILQCSAFFTEVVIKNNSPNPTLNIIVINPGYSSLFYTLYFSYSTMRNCAEIAASCFSTIICKTSSLFIHLCKKHISN